MRRGARGAHGGIRVRFGSLGAFGAVHSEFLAFRQAENDLTDEAGPKRKEDVSSAH